MRTLRTSRDLLLLALLATAAACSSDGLGVGEGRDLSLPYSPDIGGYHPEDLRPDDCLSGCADIGPPPDLAPASCPQPDEQARTEVRIHVRNDAATDRFVAAPTSFNVTGWCTSFGLAHTGGTEIPIERGFQCGCECAAPAGYGANHYRRLHPGESFELTSWDGRGLEGCTVQLDCTQWGWPGGGVVSQEQFHAEPLPSGLYRVTIALEQSPPANCTTTDDVDYTCQPQWNGLNGNFPGPTLGLCPSTQTASTDFLLPWSGPADVTVVIQ